MRKKIKIIDILCKINCNEEVPYKIKYVINEYTYDYEIQDYYDKNYNYLFEELFVGYDTSRVLETEVEILDEEDEFEDIESFGVHYSWDYIDYKNIEELKKYVNKDFQNIFDTLDKLIKNQKKIISKLGGKND